MAEQLDVPRHLDLYSIMPTLFTERGAAVDAGAMAFAAEWMTDQGISDLLLTGSYGEFQSLDDDERVSVLRAVRAQAGVRSVMACAAHPSTSATAGLAERLVDEGADLVMVAAPLLSEVTETEVFRHFEYLSDQFPGRLVVYNNPVFGTELSAEALGFVTAFPGIVAIKQGTTSLRSLTASIRAVDQGSEGTARVLIASDLTGVLGLLAGAGGLTSTNSWAFPRAFVQLIGAAVVADWERARQISGALESYFALARRFGQPRTVKAVMQVRGLPGTGEVRLPYVPLENAERTELAATLEQCDMNLSLLGIAAPEGTRNA